MTCQNAQMKDIPLDLIDFLRTTSHQNLIVDLTGNILSIISCQFFQIPTILTLILNQNQFEYLPSCFSQSSIEYLYLNHNRLHFNETSLLSSSKLLHLDLSANNITSLPRTFFTHLRRLRRLIIDGNENLFHGNNDLWIRSLTTRNQLTLVICKENFRLSLCLFDSLFQTKKLLAIQLNPNLHCDCSFVHLPMEKIHFQYCQSQGQQLSQQGICNPQSSPFEPGDSVIHLQNPKYRQMCAEEYHTCRSLSTSPSTTTTTTEEYTSSSIESSSITHSSEISTILTTTTTTTISTASITTTSTTTTIATTITTTTTIATTITTTTTIATTITTTTTIVITTATTTIAATTTTITIATTTTISSKKENVTTGAVISFILVLLIVSIICLYVVLSGHLFRMKNRRRTTDLTVRKKEHQQMPSESIPIDNINTNFNPQKTSFRSYYQRTNSSSEEDADLTFYSLNNTNPSSTSFLQTSITEMEITSTTSTIDSSFSNETIVISNRQKPRIY